MTPGSRTLRPATAINKRRNSTVKGLKTSALARDNNSRILERDQNIPLVVPADKISVRDQNIPLVSLGVNIQNTPLVVPADKISVRDRNAETVAPVQNTAIRDSKASTREQARPGQSVSAAYPSSKTSSTAQSSRSSPASPAQGHLLAGDIVAARSELTSIRGAISSTERTLRNLESNRQERRITRQQLRSEAAQQKSDTMRELCRNVESEQDRLDKLFLQLDRLSAATEVPSKKNEHLHPKAKETHGATERKTTRSKQKNEE